MSTLALIPGSLGFVTLPLLLGYASGYHVRKFAGEYYPKLQKPWWGPPRAFFKPIWVVMYLLNGIASFLVWREYIINNVSVSIPLSLYGTQLFFALNWPPLFFRIQSPLIALWDLLFTLTFAILTNITFALVSPIAGKIYLPYVIWLTIIGYFNKKVWRLNEKKKSSTPKPKKKKKKVVVISESDSESESSGDNSSGSESD